MAFAYVLDPTNQYQNRAGVNNVHGFFKVYINDTDDIAVTYKDFNGTLNPERIDIDNNGRAVIIADSSRPYRVEMYEPNGTLVFTQYPVWTVASGGGMSMVNVESTDGSVSVQKTSAGGLTTYDLSVDNEDDSRFLDWIKCSWYDLVDGAYVPRYASGTMSVGAKGVNLAADMLYHVTATVRANKTGERSPFYDNIGVHFSLFDGENTVEVQNFTRIVDHSLGLSQDFTVDADIKVGSLASQLVVTIDGAESGITFNLMSVEAHRIYSGVPKIPDGIASESWVDDNYQKKLVAGDGITIDPNTNEISAEAQAQVQSDWAQADSSAVDYIKNKPSIPAAQVQSDWGQTNNQAVDFIKNKPNLATVATSGSYNDLTDKPDIPSQQEQANWTEQDSSKPSYIKNKPNLASVATSGSYDDLSNKPTIPPAQVQSNWNESDSSSKAFIQNKPNLASVATSGSYDDLSNKPSIPAAQVQSDWDQSNSSAVDFIKNKPNIPVVPQMKNLVAGQHVTITEDGNDIVITAEGGGGQFTQEQANWNETDTSSPAYILNKPNIPAAQVQSDWSQSDNTQVDFIKNKPNLASVATSGDYDDLSNKPNIPAAPVQSNWNESDSSSLAYIQNKPNLASVATSGSYDDLSNKPSIPAAQVQSDWSQSDNTQVDYIKNKPNLASVATSGSYDDLSDKPSIPAAPVQSNWNEADSSSLAYIQNKPNLASVATSGSYNDLSNKPSIPAAQVQSDWSQSDNTQVDFIKNKPNLATVATSGSYDDLSNKPSIPAAQVQSDWSQSNSSAVDYIKNKPNLANVATSGSYNDLSDKPSIPAAQVQSNWNESDTSSKAYIQNKPSLAAVATSGNYSDLNGTPTIPTVDQTYDGTSSNAQSGVAIASALSGKEDDFDAGEGLEFTTDGQGNRVLQVEGPVDIVAGPGIVIDNPDGNTLRISQATPCDETVIWTVPSGSEDSNNYNITLSETIHNFEEIAVYCKCTRATGLQVTTKNVYPVCDAGNTMFADGISTNHWNVTAGQNAHYTVGVDVRLTGSTGYIGENYRWGVQTGTTTWEVSRASDNSIYPHPYKIVGIKRVANN